MGDEGVPKTQCPSCGAIYAKVAKRLQDETRVTKRSSKKTPIDNKKATSFATVGFSIIARYKLLIIAGVVFIVFKWTMFLPDSEEASKVSATSVTDTEAVVTDATSVEVQVDFPPELRRILSRFQSDASGYGVEVTENDMQDEINNGRNQIRWLGYIAPDGPILRREIQALSDEEKELMHKVKCLSGGEWKYLGALPRDFDYSQCWVATKVTEKLKNSQPHLFIVIGDITSTKWVSYQWDRKSNAWVTYTKDEKLQNARWMLEKEQYRLPEFFDTQTERQEKSQERNAERNQRDLDQQVEALQSAQASGEPNEIQWKTRNLKMLLIKPYRYQIQRVAATSHLSRINEMLDKGKIYNKIRGRFE
jgi:hypothetical protein